MRTKALHFLKVVVAFPHVAAGDEAKALTTIADRLCAEFGYPLPADAQERPAPGDDPRHDLFGADLGPEDEKLIRMARRNLTRLAGALGARHQKIVSETTYQALFDGAETAMRSELSAGVPMSELLPSLVFLIVLPMVTREEALEFSQRTAQLLQEPSRSRDSL